MSALTEVRNTVLAALLAGSLEPRRQLGPVRGRDRPLEVTPVTRARGKRYVRPIQGDPMTRSRAAVVRRALLHCSLAVAVLAAGCSGCSNEVTVTIRQNEQGNYVYDPTLAEIDASTNGVVIFRDAANVVHAVEIRLPPTTPTGTATVITTGRVMPGGEWRWNVAASTYAAGTRLPVSEPASVTAAGGPHATERGTIRFK